MKDTTILHIKMSLLVMVSTTQAVKQLRKVFCGSGGATEERKKTKHHCCNNSDIIRVSSV